jgi:hypothetical protein
MTREEAIKELSYIADEMPSMECKDWKEAICMAIKALEQQPFINKPCVSEGACKQHTNTVLDKIREEIDALKIPVASYGDWYDWYDGVADCLKIIDKYKAESEEICG